MVFKLHNLLLLLLWSTKLVKGEQGILNWEPQIAILCNDNEIFYPQYTSDKGYWKTFTDVQKDEVCPDEANIFKLCKKIYGSMDIVNIVESAHYTKVGNWCKNENTCENTTHWVKPFRCLEAPFQSDALLVPEGCLFDHIHNASNCFSFNYWNHTSTNSCLERKMQIRSFAMLLPCGISLFSGVEFVCCPFKGKTSEILNEESTSEKSMENLGADPYFGVFDPKLEHQNYKEAQQRLEESHREKVTRVMKEWSDLEEKYQDMRSKNPDSAQEFKQKMTERFQISVQSLEEEESAIKHKLSAMHQQRVLERINQRKRDAMTCYTKALTSLEPEVNVVEKCLQKLLRALYKDRSHALAHFRHVLVSQKHNDDGIAAEKTITLSRLTDIDKAISQAITMLNRFPELSKKLSQLMVDYIQAFRSKEKIPYQALNFSKQEEESLLENYKLDVLSHLASSRKDLKIPTTSSSDGLADEKYSTEFISSVDVQTKTEYFVKDELTTPSQTTDDKLEKVVQTVAALLSQNIPKVKQHHAMRSLILHGEPSFEVKHHLESSNLTWIFGSFVVILTLVIAYAKLRSPNPISFDGIKKRDGKVNQEEKHLKNMQTNGYENPTYKYFEIK